MDKYRRNRINDQVTKEMAEILRTIKDPRISGSFISVTGAEVTPDLKYAKIYYSVMPVSGKETDYKEIQQGLYSAAGYIRRDIAGRLNLRATPEFSFHLDESIASGAHINKLLHDVEEELRRSSAESGEYGPEEENRRD